MCWSKRRRGLLAHHPLRRQQLACFLRKFWAGPVRIAVSKTRVILPFILNDNNNDKLSVYNFVIVYYYTIIIMSLQKIGWCDQR